MSARWRTIPEMFFAQAKAHPSRPALKAKHRGLYREISWEELVTQVEETALGLIDVGIQPGDRVAILSESRPEWAIADLAILSVGGVTVPIYATLAPSEVGYILRDAGAQLVFVSSPELMAKFLPFKNELGLKTILFDAPYRVAGPRIWWLGELVGLGQTSGPEMKEALSRRLSAIREDTLASIIYTSGTTGPPKGVMLTH